MAVGAMVQTGSPEIAEMIARAGFDFVIVDGEQGPVGVDAATHLFRAIECGGAAPVIRLPDDTPSAIARVLDAGALGAMHPNVLTKEQAGRTALMARYRPAGSRGACPVIRAADYGLLLWRGSGMVEREHTCLADYRSAGRRGELRRHHGGAGT